MTYYVLAETRQPSNSEVTEILDQLKALPPRLAAMQEQCAHKYTVIGYSEYVDPEDGCYRVGLFNIRCGGGICGHEQVIFNTPPICPDCQGALTLVVWEGETRNGGADPDLLAWNDESYRRAQERATSTNLTATDDLYPWSFGAYRCLNSDCPCQSRGPAWLYWTTGGD